MLNIGCHLSSSKGYEAMGKVALSIGANTFQFFTRNPRGGKAKDIDPEDLGEIFVHFCEEVIRQYGFITCTYADSAESVLIRGLKNAMANANMGNIRPKDALKTLINDRIFALCSLAAQGRFYYVESECESLMDAISQAVWDPKQVTQNIRLDDGTSDIDSMDAFEYCFERDILKLISKNGKRDTS